MTEKKLDFDDIVDDEHGKWTQVCEEHAKELDQKQLSECACGGLICGVKGCSQEAKYYFDIEEA